MDIIHGDYGECRIMDCLQGMREQKDKIFDVTLTDIPYAQGIQHKNGEVGGSNNANCTSFKQTNDEPFTLEQLNEIFRLSKNQIIFGANYYPFFPFTPCWYIWDKRVTNTQDCDQADGEMAWTNFKSSIRIFHYLWKGFLQQDIKNKEKRVHPFQKPLALWKWCIQKVNPESIFDPFCGSGTTCEIAELLGKQYLCFEIMPEYAEIIEKRIKRGIRNHAQKDLTKYLECE